MANNKNNQIQKVLIKPPLKGLNIHDNPLDLTYEFATELTNFQPPTTKLEVRPGIKNLIGLSGTPLGIYSYSVGARKIYKTGVLITMPAISSPAYSFILIKMLQGNNDVLFDAINPISLELKIMSNFKTDQYSSEYCMYDNSMFFLDGSNTTMPFIFSGERGVDQMVFLTPGTGSEANKNITDIDNLVVYDGYLYANSKSSLNIYYMEASAADPNSPTASWVNRIFRPTCTGVMNLNGVLKKGGSILYMFGLSANQHDNLQAYFCVLTTLGELLVYQGGNPTLAKDGQWKLLGNFNIPVPLNKRCICKVEGDVIVATSKGLFSLQRVVFGHASPMTEALEWRISSLFDQYEFRMNAFRDFFFLKYHNNNRQLYFNVPEQVPVNLYDVIRGYVMDENVVLSFDLSILDDVNYYDTFIAFIRNYIIKRGISYEVRYNINEKPGNCIYIAYKMTLPEAPEELDREIVYIEVSFGCYVNNVFKSFLKMPSGVEDVSKWRFEVKGYLDADTCVITPVIFYNDWTTNEGRKTINTDAGTFVVCIEDLYKEYGETIEITSIVPRTEVFAQYTDTNFLTDLYEDNTTVTRMGFLIYTPRTPLNPHLGSYTDPTTGLDVYLPPFNEYGKLGQTVNINDYLSAMLADNWSGENWLTTRDPCAMHFPFDNQGWKKGVVCLDDMDVQNMYTSRADLNFPILNADDTPTGSSFVTQVNHVLRAGIIWRGAFRGSDINIYVDSTCTLYFNINGVYHALVGTSRTDFWQGDIPLAHGNSESEVRGYWEASTFKSRSTSQLIYQIDGKTFEDFNFFNKKIGRLEPIGEKWITWTHSISEARWWGNYSVWQNHLANEDSGYAQFSTQARVDELYRYKGQWRNMLGYLQYFKIGSEGKDNSFKENTNFDYSMVPLLNAVKVISNYKSSQYVFDTHYATWSKYEDVNMIDAVEHETDFYFLRLKDIELPTDDKNAPVLPWQKTSMFCKFDPDLNGDFADSFSGNGKPIRVSCKGGHTDIGLPQLKKQFKQVDVFGSRSVFWSDNATELSPVFLFSYSTDFEDQPDVLYPYYNYTLNNFYDTIYKMLKAKGIDKKYKDMNYKERKEFNKLYALVSSQVKNITLPLISTPATRISVGFKLNAVEHNLLIYGYEIYYEVVNP